MRLLAASVGTICALCLLPASGRPGAAGSADIAALQVALRAADAYAGAVDGWRGAGDGGSAARVPTAAGARARRHRRPPHTPGARTPRQAGARRPLAGRRRTRLGRRRAPVQARLARLSLGAVRRRLRPTPGGRGAPLPALRPLAANRRRRTEDRVGAASASAHEPPRAQPAGRRRARRRVRSPGRRLPCRPRLRRPCGNAGDGLPSRARRVGGPAGQLRQRGRRRTRQRRQDAPCASRADRRRPARARLARQLSSARSARPDALQAPTSTSRCGCAALPSTRSTRSNSCQPSRL